jgi:hypothetical protein
LNFKAVKSSSSTSNIVEMAVSLTIKTISYIINDFLSLSRTIHQTNHIPNELIKIIWKYSLLSFIFDLYPPNTRILHDSTKGIQTIKSIHKFQQDASIFSSTKTRAQNNKIKIKKIKTFLSCQILFLNFCISLKNLKCKSIRLNLKLIKYRLIALGLGTKCEDGPGKQREIYNVSVHRPLKIQ